MELFLFLLLHYFLSETKKIQVQNLVEEHQVLTLLTTRILVEKLARKLSLAPSSSVKKLLLLVSLSLVKMLDQNFEEHLILIIGMILMMIPIPMTMKLVLTIIIGMMMPTAKSLVGHLGISSAMSSLLIPLLVFFARILLLVYHLQILFEGTTTQSNRAIVVDDRGDNPSFIQQQVGTVYMVCQDYYQYCLWGHILLSILLQ
jgi:hypothetical protein